MRKTSWLKSLLVVALGTCIVISLNLYAILEDHRRGLADHGHLIPPQQLPTSSRQQQHETLRLRSASECRDNDDVYCGKEKLIQILAESGIDKSAIDNQTWAQVPLWDDIAALYGGDRPRIVGLDGTCRQFQERVPAEARMVGVSGLFNTGTNLLAQLLEKNCRLQPDIGSKWRQRRSDKYSRIRRSRNGVEFQVPWGKHVPAKFRHNGTAEGCEGINPDDVLPVVLIREPYEWMNSMCHNNYVLRWPHRKRCPNLVHPNGSYVTVMNQYYHGHVKEYHTSLAHLWNDWNGQYVSSIDPKEWSFPRLILRHKDIVFFPKETTELVCECAGGTIYSDPFQYILKSAKGNRKGAPPFDGLVGNWIKYGKKEFDITKLNREDVELAYGILDSQLMAPFGYRKRHYSRQNID